MAPPGITLDLNCDGSDADAAARAAEGGSMEEENMDYFFD